MQLPQDKSTEINSKGVVNFKLFQIIHLYFYITGTSSNDYWQGKKAVQKEEDQKGTCNSLSAVNFYYDKLFYQDEEITEQEELNEGLLYVC